MNYILKDYVTEKQKQNSTKHVVVDADSILGLLTNLCSRPIVAREV